MASGELSFEERAREAVLAWHQALERLHEGEEHVLAMLPVIGQKPEDVRGFGDMLDNAEKAVTALVDILSNVLGMRLLAQLLGEELTTFESGKGPLDIRDKLRY